MPESYKQGESQLPSGSSKLEIQEGAGFKQGKLVSFPICPLAFLQKATDEYNYIILI